MKVKLYLNKQEVTINKDVIVENMQYLKTKSYKFTIPTSKRNKNFYFM